MTDKERVDAIELTDEKRIEKIRLVLDSIGPHPSYYKSDMEFLLSLCLRLMEQKEIAVKALKYYAADIGAADAFSDYFVAQDTLTKIEELEK